MTQLPTFLAYVPYAVFLIALAGFVVALVRKRARDPKETLANFGIWGLNQILKATVTGGSMLVILKAFAPYALFTLPRTGAVFALTVLVADLTYYWHHRAAHHVRFLWAFHNVHHSSKEFNLSTAIRLPWFGATPAAFFSVPAVLLGFDPTSLFVGYVLVLLYQYGIHTESVGRLGPLEAIVNSPSNHRVHHGSNARYLDKNFGGILIVWDRLFGTYQAEDDADPVVYGLTKPLKSYNPFTINFVEPLHILRDVTQARSWREALGYIFRGPGWRPQADVPRGAVAPADSGPASLRA